MLANIVAGVNKAIELDPKTKYLLAVSSDIPAIKPEMVDWLVNTCMETKDDLYYGVCPREVMESRFPGSNRTYIRLKDIDLCGADINVTHVRMATEHLDLWESLIGNRKSPMRQAATIGFDTLFQVATRSITLNDLVEKVCKRIGIRGRAIIWDHAEPCMDVDKPHQLELLRADLEHQQRDVAAPAAKKSTKVKGGPKKVVKTKASKSIKSSQKKVPVSRLKTKAKAKA
jgi:hypothetical protein